MDKKKKKSGVLVVLITILVAVFITSIIGLVIVLTSQTGTNGGVLAITFFGLILSAVCLITLISSYNGVVRLKHKIDESLALVDIQLKLRFDLIPNLVETVKGYAKHEKEVLTEIAELRKLAVSTSSEKKKLAYANQLVPKMRQIIAIAENYPKLKADTMFKSLLDELVLIEDKIVAARRFYDSNVSAYNTKIEVWPSNIIARLYGFTRCELYKIDSGERINVKVELGESDDN